jgi:hypothetical protein
MVGGAQTLPCRMGEHGGGARAAPRIDRLIQIGRELWPGVRQADAEFRRFCISRGVQRHGRSEVMLLRLIIGDMVKETARRYADVVRYAENNPERAKQLGIVNTHLAFRGHNLPGSDEPIIRYDFAERVIMYFAPNGFCLDPCRGHDGGFFPALKQCVPECDWCEVTRGRDFLQWRTRCAWIFCNPPWNDDFEPIALHCYEIADDIVFLLRAGIMTTRRVEQYLAAGFDIREDIVVRWDDAFVIRAPASD